MKNITALIVNDFKNIFRDDVLKIMFVIPFFLILALHYGLPPLIEMLPVIADYKYLIVTVMCLIIASFPAFLVAFIMLDEKDEGIFVIYKILPVSHTQFFIYRLGFLIFFSWFFSLLVLLLSGPEGMMLWQKFSAALLFALLPPFITLLTVTFARNKVEGVTIMKMLNFLLFLPVAAFFVHSGWEYVFGIIPMYWTYKIIETVNDTGWFLGGLFTGIVLHLLFISFVFRVFIKRV